MLTNDDLKAVRKVIREEVEAESENNVRSMQSELKLFRMELSLRLDNVEDRLKDNEIATNKTFKNIERIMKDIKKIKADINRVIGYTDELHISLRKRVAKLEDNLGIRQD